MIITNVSYRVLEVQERVKFKIAHTAQNDNRVVQVKICTDNNLVGYGEATPSPIVTKETIETVVEFLKAFKDSLIGLSPYELERIHTMMDTYMHGNSAAKASIDIALYDLCAKGANLPLYRYLGGSSPEIYSDMSIGIDKPQAMAQLALKYKQQGFTILKVKNGINPDDDVEAVRLIREAVGPEMDIRLDANQGWGVKTALRTLERMQPYGVVEVEQPVRDWDLEGLKYIKERVNIDVMADEAVLTPQDAFQLASLKAADVINIKLMKSSGIYPALKINAIAEAANINCMVGCMNETPLGIAAGAALVAALDNITYADLDGHLLLEDIPGMQVYFKQKGGLITLSERPGLGIEIEQF